MSAHGNMSYLVYCGEEILPVRVEKSKRIDALSLRASTVLTRALRGSVTQRVIPIGYCSTNQKKKGLVGYPIACVATHCQCHLSASSNEQLEQCTQASKRGVLA